MTTFILSIIGNSDPSGESQNLLNAANIVSWVLRFVPHFNLGKGLFFAINIEILDYWEGGEEVSAWSKPVLLYEVIFLACESIAYPILAIFLDKWSTNPKMVSIGRGFIKFITCQCCFGMNNESQADLTASLPDDEDVLIEQDRVLNNGANNDLIVIRQLTKVYDNGKVAVNNLSLGIPPGQCFGLLGINGAGKTTTMGMLTAEFPPTSGDAILAGFSVTKQPESIRRRIGYCPQFDAHFANMTGREHVELYASIKGIPSEFVKKAAADKLSEVGLDVIDCDRLSSGYSGGMKRRLSLACAMIGKPQIVFLDECSTGVDPVARREIWQLISNMVAGDNLPEGNQTSVILTTHSMEECEALCPRIGIMANGRLRCLGSSQRLKNKFGQGFQVEMRVLLIDPNDKDYVANAISLYKCKGSKVDDFFVDEERNDVSNEVFENDFFTMQEACTALRSLTNDNFLPNMLNEGNPNGYNVFKDATSNAGVSLEVLAAFATMEIRLRNVANFMNEKYPGSHVLRERQDSKVRYEVSSEAIRISSIFASIEESRGVLWLADYGVSQTSLEQVFNMHAAEAEGLKQGRNDR